MKKQYNYKDIKEFYHSGEFSPLMPNDYSHRHFRVKTVDKNWVRIPRKIRSQEELIRWINKTGGIDIYYSTSLWSSPEKVRSEKEYLKKPVSDNRLIKNDLVFDIDGEEPITINSLEKARMITNNLYEAMKNYPNYKFRTVEFSGYKGFRLTYKDNNPLPADTKLRVPYLRAKRECFVEQIKNYIITRIKEKDPRYYSLNTVFDEKITTNPFCVIRVLGTAHSTTKFISSEISILDITKPVKEITKNIPFVGSKSFRIPREREMTQETRQELPRSRLSKPEVEQLKDGSTSKPLNEEAVKFFYTNKVIGCKNGYVPFLIYQSKQKYLREVKRLQKKYSLGPLTILTQDNKIYVVSVKLMQYEQLVNLLLETKCINKSSYAKHKRSRIPITANKEKVIHGELIGGASKAHAKIYSINHNELSGKQELEITKAQ